MITARVATNAFGSRPFFWSKKRAERRDQHHDRFDEKILDIRNVRNASGTGTCIRIFYATKILQNGYFFDKSNVSAIEIAAPIRRRSKNVSFIVKIFLFWKEFLNRPKTRANRFGVLTRIDLWTIEITDFLGESGCVSFDTEVMALTPESCARAPFVQANLTRMRDNDADMRPAGGSVLMSMVSRPTNPFRSSAIERRTTPNAFSTRPANMIGNGIAQMISRRSTP